MTKSLHCLLYALGLEGLNAWTACASWADRQAVQCCGSVYSLEEWGSEEKEREPNLFTELNFSISGTRSFGIISSHSGAPAPQGTAWSKSGGNWDMCVWEREREKTGKEGEKGERMRKANTERFLISDCGCVWLVWHSTQMNSVCWFLGFPYRLSHPLEWP